MHVSTPTPHAATTALPLAPIPAIAPTAVVARRGARMVARTAVMAVMAVPVLIAAFALAGCGDRRIPGVYRLDVQQGNVVEQEQLAMLEPGMNKSKVQFVLGTPLVVDVFNQDRWNYVYTFQKGGGDVAQRRVSLHFEDGLLTRIDGDLEAPSPGAASAEAETPRETVVSVPPRREPGLLGFIKGALEKGVPERAPEDEDAPEAQPASADARADAPASAAETPAVETASTETASAAQAGAASDAAAGGDDPRSYADEEDGGFLSRLADRLFGESDTPDSAGAQNGAREIDGAAENGTTAGGDEAGAGAAAAGADPAGADAAAADAVAAGAAAAAETAADAPAADAAAADGTGVATVEPGVTPDDAREREDKAGGEGFFARMARKLGIGDEQGDPDAAPSRDDDGGGGGDADEREPRAPAEARAGAASSGADDTQPHEQAASVAREPSANAGAGADGARGSFLGRLARRYGLDEEPESSGSTGGGGGVGAPATSVPPGASP